jgi:hypothetical protein
MELGKGFVCSDFPSPGPSLVVYPDQDIGAADVITEDSGMDVTPDGVLMMTGRSEQVWKQSQPLLVE